MIVGAGLRPTTIGAIAETFERIDAAWVEGAELPPAELEDAIDAAALVEDLPALLAALDAYEQRARSSAPHTEAAR